MAVQSTVYELITGDNRFFASSKTILSKSHVAIWIKNADDTYTIQSMESYELVENSIVFPSAPVGKTLELRVGDSPNDLVAPPNDIAIVAAIADEIREVARISPEVQVVAGISDKVEIVAGLDSEITDIANNIDDILLAKEYAVNPQGVPITNNPTDFSSLSYSKDARLSALDAAAEVRSINLPAGMVMEWYANNAPTGWFFCDGDTKNVFHGDPAQALDELYRVLENEPTYVMAEAPVDWYTIYPDDVFYSWSIPESFEYQNYLLDGGQGVLPSEAKLATDKALTVTMPDKRGVFTRGQMMAGSGLPRPDGANTLSPTPLITDTMHGNYVWKMDAIKSHRHTYSYEGDYGDRQDVTTAGHSNTALDNVTNKNSNTGYTGGAETNPRYIVCNYIIRARSQYNGDGYGSGGTGVVPNASEITYNDSLHNVGLNNLQDTTDRLFFDQVIVPKDVGIKDGSDLLLYTGPNYAGKSLCSTMLNDGRGCVVWEHNGQQKFKVVNLNTGATDVSYSPSNLYSGYMEQSGYGFSYFNHVFTPLDLIGNSFNIGANVGSVESNCCSFMRTRLQSDYIYYTYQSSTAIRRVNITTGVTDTLVDAAAGGGTAYDTYVKVQLATDDDGMIYCVWLDRITCYDPFNNVWLTSLTDFIPNSHGNYAKAADATKPRAISHFNDTLTVKVGSPSGVSFVTVKVDKDVFANSKIESLPLPTDSIVGARDSAFGSAFEYLGVGIFTAILTSFDRPFIRKYLLDLNARKYNFYAKEYGNKDLTTTATGSMSLHTDVEAITGGANGDYSLSSGLSTRTDVKGGVAVGKHNATFDAQLVVGIGTAGTPKDGVVVKTDGDVQAPNRLSAPTAKSLVTSDNYGTATTGGTAKFRSDGTNLYITTDGTDA